MAMCVRIIRSTWTQHTMILSQSWRNVFPESMCTFWGSTLFTSPRWYDVPRADEVGCASLEAIFAHRQWILAVSTMISCRLMQDCNKRWVMDVFGCNLILPQSFWSLLSDPSRVYGLEISRTFASKCLGCLPCKQMRCWVHRATILAEFFQRFFVGGLKHLETQL